MSHPDDAIDRQEESRLRGLEEEAEKQKEGQPDTPPIGIDEAVEKTANKIAQLCDWQCSCDTYDEDCKDCEVCKKYNGTKRILAALLASKPDVEAAKQKVRGLPVLISDIDKEIYVRRDKVMAILYDFPAQLDVVKVLEEVEGKIRSIPLEIVRELAPDEKPVEKLTPLGKFREKTLAILDTAIEQARKKGGRND